MHRQLLIVLVFLAGQAASAQHHAALQRLQQRYTQEQIAELRLHAHYKYAGLLLFYSASFLVEHDGAFIAPNEHEILAVDLHAYDAARTHDADVVVDDAQLGRRVKLLSRRAFEDLVLQGLSPEDRAAYLAYKEAALAPGHAKNP